MKVQGSSKEQKSTEVWVALVFVLSESNCTDDEATKRLGELLRACVGRFAGLKAVQNAGTFVGGHTGVLVGGKLGLLSLALTQMLCAAWSLNSPEEPKLENPKELSMGFPKGFEWENW